VSNEEQDKNSTQAILSDLMSNTSQSNKLINFEPVEASTNKVENTFEEPTSVLVEQYDNQWFIEKEQQLVMLQLIAVSDEETLQQFIMNHSLNQVRIYQTQRNNAPWWVVTIGPYQNIAQSQQAKLQLEARLLALAPFSKTIKTIQAEIARIQPN
jgi:DamX protein